MRIIFKSIGVFLLMGTANTQACLSVEGLEKFSSLSYVEASQHLDRWLLKPTSKHAADMPQPAPTTSDINCYLLEQAKNAPLFAKIAHELEKIGNAIIKAETSEQRGPAIIKLNNSINRDSGTAYVIFPNGSDSPTEFDLYQYFLKPFCSETISPSCAEALSLAAHLWWIAGYYRSIPDYYNDENIISSLAFNEKLNRKWSSYRDDTILLWPQEVLLNSLVFKQEKQGFTEPPNYKLLSLRPSIGLSYLSDEDHHIQPTLNLDLLGIYWWEYGGKDGSEAQPGRGLATTLIWDGSDTALGLTYHHNPKWSATIAHGEEDDVVLSISFQLATWLLKPGGN